MDVYRQLMRDIGRERANFLNKVDLIQPSIEEQHQLEWSRRYQEQEIASLTSELARIMRDVEHETEQLQSRENIIRTIQEEQRQDRIKIQTLLALSQPVTPDITVVLDSLGPSAVRPGASSRRRPRSRSSSNERSAPPPRTPSGAGLSPDGTAEESLSMQALGSGNDMYRRASKMPGVQDGSGQSWGRSGKRSDLGGVEHPAGNADGEAARNPLSENSELLNDVPLGTYAGAGQAWDEDVKEPIQDRRQTRRPEQRGRRRRSTEATGRERDGRERHRDGTSRLRCTRGYREHLERRLELAHTHLADLGRLDREYKATLERDQHERRAHVSVQKENISQVQDSLRRRAEVVEERLARATDEYLRLRHEAREAHALSAREQRQCAEAQERGDAQVRSILASARAEIDNIKSNGQERLEDSTLELREQLLVEDRALQKERSYHADIKRRYEERVARAQEGVVSLRHRHRKLVGRRAEEVVFLSEEMSALRRGVTELERRMFAAW